MTEIDYHDGERYPVLERVDGTPDYLDEITKPLTTPEKAAGRDEDFSSSLGFASAVRLLWFSSGDSTIHA